VLGCVQQASSGGQCGPGAAAAAFGKIATGLTQDWSGAAQFAVTTVVGGTVSVIGGGKFANGAAQAGFGYLFNSLSKPKDTVEAKVQQAILNGDAAELRLALGEVTTLSASDVAIAQRALAAMETVGVESAKALATRYGVDWAQKAHHVFGQSKHGLDSLAQTIGSREAAFAELQRAVDAAYKATGQFPKSVDVRGTVVRVQGAIVDNLPRINTGFR
jgi:filamentous hemagglutinin